MMASENELDRNTIFEKFASIKRMHDEVGRQQTEDYQRRLQKLKEEESNYMTKLLSQQIPNPPQQDISGRAQNSARRDLFLTSKNDTNQSNISQSQQYPHRQQQQQQQHHHHQPYKASTRSSSSSHTHHQDSYENIDHDWNIDDDIQPLNITDNDGFEERLPNRLSNDDDVEDSYLTAYHQLLQNHQQQQQQMMLQQEQENMLSTILEASCEDATPMTSLVDVHQQRVHLSPTRRTPVATVQYENVEEEEEEQEDDDDAEEEDELTDRPRAQSFASIDDIPVSTVFSKNENLKYSEYIHQKLQTEIHSFIEMNTSLQSNICNSNNVSNTDMSNSMIPTNSSPTKLAYSYSNIQDILQCPICLDCFKDPRVLPCQHVICYLCLPSLISKNKLCSIITCPLCRLIFPYTDSDQFPVSYTHIQISDLVPTNFDIKGRCSKCKEIHVLKFCPCCDYHLCEKCYKNDRGNAIIHLENIYQTFQNDFDYIQTFQPMEVNELMQKAETMLKNCQHVAYNDILLLFYRMKYIHEQVNKLPVTKLKRIHEDNTQEDTSPKKQMRIESVQLNDDDDDDDDDGIIYIDTLKPSSVPNELRTA
ncbi:hypothetical protein I4U23_013169 [Adineta vaga]|nr:hypothetical protein I4U23_013169 [Adineta vaga]